MTDRAAPIGLIRTDSLAASATVVRHRLAERAASERESEARTKREAAATKSILGNDHWHDRHRAEARLTAVRAVETAIAEILTEARDG